MKKNKSALITGITGQDGAYLAKLLLDNNYQVYGVIRNNHIYDHNLKSLNIIDKVKLLPLDFSHGEEFADILCQYRIDEVYHLAAQSSVGYSFNNPHQTIKENFNLTANLLEQVRLSKRNIKFYNSVSSEIFGNQDILPITEQSIINPVSPYGLSKAFSLQLGKLYRDLYGMFVCNGILFNHESELRRGNFFINKIINEAIQIKLGNQDTLRVGNLNIKRDFGYAPEYVKAMYLMMQHDKPDDYVVCSGNSLYLYEILNYVLAKLGLSQDVVAVDKSLVRSDEIFDIYGDNSKIKSIGWQYDLDFFNVLDAIIDNKLQNTNF